MDSLSSLAERSKALTTGGPVRIKRDLAQLLDDALLLATASAGPTLPGDVVNRAQRLLLSGPLRSGQLRSLTRPRPATFARFRTPIERPSAPRRRRP